MKPPRDADRIARVIADAGLIEAVNNGVPWWWAHAFGEWLLDRRFEPHRGSYRDPARRVE